MQAIKLDATLEERTSEKSGKTYKVVVIKLTDTYEKLVFLEQAENQLLILSNKDKMENPFA